MIPALLATCLFSLSAVSAGRSTRLLGAAPANVARLVLAGLCLAAWAHTAGQGVAGPGLPWFLASGVIGFGLGDLALYASYPKIGPRLGVLLCLCLSVPVGAVAEWLWLGTTLTAYQIAWTTTILVGVILALAPARGEVPRVTGAAARRVRLAGTVLGLIAALGQGLGAVLTRRAYDVAEGTGVSIDGGTAAYQRILGGLALTFVVVGGRGLLRVRRADVGAGGGADPWRRAWPWVILNALSGPAIGVACFQWALKVAPTGPVLAIVSMTPLAVIPLTMLIDGERPHLRSVLGGVVAVAGAVALVL